ncbi:hypothetical protein M441DRAFT_128305, partial [Trichoderma asperellum CBS 433.97]
EETETDDDDDGEDAKTEADSQYSFHDAWPNEEPERKLQDDLQRRREARDELVENLRRYGLWLLGAVVLLPPQLVAMGLVITAFAYLCTRRDGRQRHHSRRNTAG